MNPGRTVSDSAHGPPRTVWAYACEIVPPQTRSRLRAVRALLDQGHSTAGNGDRAWAGRLIVGAQATRILVVSDSLEHSAEVNRRLEAELNRLQAAFTVGEPVPVPADGTE
jgi:tRNA/tmRNA/rRNA uracil-C5-methylase (TrmA/RlmC/RlmD family)